jgi:uroporphyrinogen-III synthase
MTGGMTQAILLLTRPAGASTRFLAMLPDGRPHVISPLMRIVPLTPELAAPPAALILTSEPGVAALRRLGLPAGLPTACVGHATATAARAAGADVRLVAPDAARLLAELADHPLPGPVLHLCGEHTRGDIVPNLRAMGQDAAQLVVYRQDALALTEAAETALAGATPLVVPLFSPRTAALFRAAAAGARAPLHLCCISPPAAVPLRGMRHASLRVAATPDADGMRSIVQSALAQADAP